MGFQIYLIAMVAWISFLFGNSFGILEMTRAENSQEGLTETARGCARIALAFLVFLLFTIAVRWWWSRG